jgi:NTE family protein
MNALDSSGARGDIDRNGPLPDSATSLRSGASALLSQLEIWSSATTVPAPTTGTPRPNLAAESSDAEGSMRVLAQHQPAFVKSAGANPAPKPDFTPRAHPTEAGIWPPKKLSLALQGGGTFTAFSWGVLERLLEEPGCEFDSISGSSAGAVNAILLGCGLARGGREQARKLLAKFWNRMVDEASFRSLMLLGGFSPAGSSVAFGTALRSGQFDPLDLDPLRRTLRKHIRFEALRAANCPRLLIAATRVRDGRQHIFGNNDITADVLLASTCPPLPHCAVEIEGETYWDGGYGANPPLVRLLKESESTDVLLVQVTPARDSYIPITTAAIDRRLDQITANSVLNAEIAAFEWARRTSIPDLRLFRISAEDEIDGLAQRSAVDLGRNFISLLHRSGRKAADRWLKQISGNPSGFVEQQPRATNNAQPSRLEPV